MGIQINGNNDTISAIDGSLNLTGAELPSVTNLNATGIVTATTISVGSGTSISSPATNVLTLGTNNIERVRIGSTGSVGIGTNESYGDSNASFTSLSLGGNGTRYGLIELNKSDGIAGSWIDCYGTGGNGDLRITTAGTSGAITFWTGGAFTEKVRIDSSGNIGIGTTNPATKLDVNGEITIRRTAAGSEGGQVNFARASDNTVAWNIDAYGATSTPSLRFIDAIVGVSRADIDSSGNFTVSSGNIVIGTSGKGIDFSATANSGGTMTSELLNDYEEGTWTPRISGTSGGDYTPGANNVGHYTKVGRIVTASATVHWTAAVTPYSGLLTVTGLPYTALNASNYRSGGNIPGQSVGIYASGSYNILKAGIDGNNSFVYIVMAAETISAGNNYSHYPNVLSSGILYGFTITYLTN